MKKGFSITLIICLVLCCFTPLIHAYNITLTSTATFLSANEYEAIIEVLNIVNLEKEAVNLEDANFNNLKIGNKIYRYNYTGTGFQCTSYSYPIIYNGKVVLVATPDMNGKFQISTYEAEAINKSGVKNVALVYDAVACYLYDGLNFELVSYSGYVIEERGYISEYIKNNFSHSSSISENNSNIVSEDAIIITDYENCVNLNFYNCFELNSNERSSGLDGYYSCMVDYVSQNNQDICWAACVAMIVNYLKGEDYTAEDIAIAYLGQENMEDGASMIEIAQLLRITYDCGAYRSSDSDISDEIIIQNINGVFPVVGGFIIANDDPHAGVIDAIHTVAGYIRVCDPACGRMYAYRDFSNESSTSYGKYAYTQSSTNTWMYMGSHVARFLPY